ncbi:hypothetical protein TH66_11405 [Carbonactinospora thermoautotrophica]|uniref:Uncharacterized protein n=1 Tax=Carbonactinospora thermoautotrophica TaxID=1469144 RepID=A0A132N1K8_9ACTN|nr:hypothetical protein TH66_11405 [Carbonactinospora thermoautotrophica]
MIGLPRGAEGGAALISGQDQPLPLRMSVEDQKVNPWRCEGMADYPHPSRTTPHVINQHFDLKCAIPAPHARIDAAMYRKRWYGWEKVATGSADKRNTARLRAVTPWKCPQGQRDRFYGIGLFRVEGGGKTWSARVYNENETHIVCS